MFYDSGKDIYPLLPHTDLLITDYSSIYFDYLILDRPLVFFPFDLEEYLSREREMYFNYQDAAPGPKCVNQRELQPTLLKILSGDADPWRAARRSLRERVFATADGQESIRLMKALLAETR